MGEPSTPGTPGKWQDSDVSLSRNPWRRPAILSFDGGGIKGYSSLLILKDLMEKVMELERVQEVPHNSSYCFSHTPERTPQEVMTFQEPQENGRENELNRYLPCHYFDYIFGTSTGGLISLMLGRLRMSVDETLGAFEDFGGEVFGASRFVYGRWIIGRAKYDLKRLESCVEQVIQRRRSTPNKELRAVARMEAPKDLCKSAVIACREKDGNFMPYLFRTYKIPPKRNYEDNNTIYNAGEGHDVKIADAAAATAAAPFYFEPKELRGMLFLDGGFGTNNPSSVACNDVAAMIGGTHGDPCYDMIEILIGIGTGNHDKLRISHRKRVLGFQNIKMLSEFMKRMTTSSNQGHDSALVTTQITKIFYRRFNVRDGMGVVSLDEWKDDRGQGQSTLDYIREKTRLELAKSDVQRNIHECAQRLVDHRRARLETDSSMWERYTTGSLFQCGVPGCNKSEKEYTRRGCFARHLKNKHAGKYTKDAERENFINFSRIYQSSV
ncbi:MAG: hypothetical protein M1834_004988 [Cirrosporium novae-zelandiae]|nr:MAG: hypothetical protein M1834_004988 [Cirrosporium novae-zelandiae]